MLFAGLTHFARKIFWDFWENELFYLGILRSQKNFPGEFWVFKIFYFMSPLPITTKSQ